jgi:hypothetical protein
MRLPARTGNQERIESARELHERLYTAFLAGNVERIELPVGDGQRPQNEWQRISGNLHRFWSQRGFRLRGRSVGAVMRIWVEPKNNSNGEKQHD